MLRSFVRLAVSSSLIAVVGVACGGDASTDSTHAKGDAGNDVAADVASGGTSGSAGASGSGGAAAASSGGTSGTSGTGGGGTGGSGGSGAADVAVDAPPPIIGTCRDPIPPGAAAPPAPPPYSGGTCPTLKPGVNLIHTSGIDRQFILVLPSDYDGGTYTEPDGGPTGLPVVFLWHWLGGSAQDFLVKGEVQAAADQMHFAAVIPDSKDDPTNFFKWPFNIASSPARVQEELDFFDDMFACVTQQVSVNLSCVASAGVSAGALWTDQLAGTRGQYFSSIMSLSGGVGGGLIQPWKTPAHRMPAFVLWGGPTDQCVTLQFETLSKNLETALITGGQFFVECLHNCAHAEPPFDPPEDMSKYTGLWQFFLAHPYWLAPGTSPYLTDGLPIGTPSWCGIGAGSATARTGTCPPPACPF